MNISGTRRQAIFFLVLTATLWSSSGLLVKIISWQPLSILSGRSILSTAVFWIFPEMPDAVSMDGPSGSWALSAIWVRSFFSSWPPN